MDRLAIKERRTAEGGQQTCDGAEQSGFSTAVRPDQDSHFLPGDRKGNIIDDDVFLIASREVLQNQPLLCRVMSHVNANLIK